MFVEGSTKDKRIGHNFSVENFYKYISPVSVKMHTNEIREILFIVKKHDIKYIIAYVAGDIQTKKHELQHAK